MVRVNIILAAYFKYRNIAVGTGEDLEEKELNEFLEAKKIRFETEEHRIFEELKQF